MIIRKTEIKNIPVLSLEGQIEINSSPQLREALEALFATHALKVVVDFEKVTYIDSSGLAVLIEMFQRFKKNKGSLVFVNLTEKIHNLFEITKIDMLLSVYDSQDKAIDSL